MNNKSGFSLIELLVVISIFSITVGMIIIKVNKYKITNNEFKLKRDFNYFLDKKITHFEKEDEEYGISFKLKNNTVEFYTQTNSDGKWDPLMSKKIESKFTLPKLFQYELLEKEYGKKDITFFNKDLEIDRKNPFKGIFILKVKMKTKSILNIKFEYNRTLNSLGVIY